MYYQYPIKPAQYQIPIIPTQTRQPAVQVAPPAPSPLPPPPQLPLTPYESLTINLPLQEYKLAKVVPIPFDPRESKGAKFSCLQEALEFVGKHCQAHHGFFTKQLSKKYLEFCRILDGPSGKYIVMKHFGKKEFDSAFNKVRQELETQKFSK